MTPGANTPTEYIEARRVLLDALVAIEAHLEAVTLVGAQAVYLRTVGRMSTYQPYTTDADLVLNPGDLADIPALGEALNRAGFALTDEPGIWETTVQRAGSDELVAIPVDLIVPLAVAPAVGRRSARLGANHGKNTARKSVGLEAALVDRSTLAVAALEPADDRELSVNVAGEAALLVAKLYKLGERLDRPHRLQPKDAGDIYRLFDVITPDGMADRLRRVLADDRAADVAHQALDFGDQMFTGPRAVGIELAQTALRGVLPAETISAAINAYWNALRNLIKRANVAWR